MARPPKHSAEQKTQICEWTAAQGPREASRRAVAKAKRTGDPSWTCSPAQALKYHAAAGGGTTDPHKRAAARVEAASKPQRAPVGADGPQEPQEGLDEPRPPAAHELPPLESPAPLLRELLQRLLHAAQRTSAPRELASLATQIDTGLQRLDALEERERRKGQPDQRAFRVVLYLPERRG